MLIDRALRALVSLGSGALHCVLRWGARYLPETTSRVPSQTIPLAHKAVTDLPHEVTGGAVLEDRQETVTFGLDGQAYELDLGHKHALELRSALQPYIRAGRRVGKRPAAPAHARRTPERQVPATGGRPDTVAIRAWARAQGYQVSDRGRIPTEVLKSYEADKLASRSH